MNDNDFYEKKSEMIPGFKVTPTLKKKVWQAAKDERRSPSDFVRLTLEKEIERRESPFRAKPVDHSEFSGANTKEE